ncbi:hypothetical protein HAX54_014251 [Datura stramonium]|uniref:Uncharacterized protein n=1 Tax=Datura stramonium TaxID=4076 RepID=A0ABS8TMU4_DATST|nr:hypothetical protein [Datura stramonium]
MSRTNNKTEAETQSDNNLAKVLRIIIVQLDALDAHLVEQNRTHPVNVQLDEDEKYQGTHGNVFIEELLLDKFNSKVVENNVSHRAIEC